jgi:hypothetical protein
MQGDNYHAARDPNNQYANKTYNEREMRDVGPGGAYQQPGYIHDYEDNYEVEEDGNNENFGGLSKDSRMGFIRKV